MPWPSISCIKIRHPAIYLCLLIVEAIISRVCIGTGYTWWDRRLQSNCLTIGLISINLSKKNPIHQNGVLYKSLAIPYFRMATCHTIIGAKRFHCRVRDGIGWFTFAIVTRQSGVSTPYWFGNQRSGALHTGEICNRVYAAPFLFLKCIPYVIDIANNSFVTHSEMELWCCTSSLTQNAYVNGSRSLFSIYHAQPNSLGVIWSSLTGN